jgi:hypothetical protein
MVAGIWPRGPGRIFARVFALDITRCRKSGGRMRVLEVVSDPAGEQQDLAKRRRRRGARAPWKIRAMASSVGLEHTVHAETFASGSEHGQPAVCECPILTD